MDNIYMCTTVYSVMWKYLSHLLYCIIWILVRYVFCNLLFSVFVISLANYMRSLLVKSTETCPLNILDFSEIRNQMFCIHFYE